MDSLLARCLAICFLFPGICACLSVPENVPVSAGLANEEVLESPAEIEASLQELKSEMARWSRHDYSVEVGMGARCPASPEEEQQSSGLIRGACRGKGPSHLVEVLKFLDAQSEWPEEERLDLQGEKHSFVAVPGPGRRPDFMMTVGRTWIRSLEGADPNITHFLVHVPFPAAEGFDAAAAWPTSPVRGDCAGQAPRLRLYEVERGGVPRDVTDRTLPPPPILTIDESHRYGPYMARIESACDSDIYLEMGNLQYASTMRWSLTDFDPETPIPESDVRSHGNTGDAHFGFLVWNGTEFEARERVAREAWPCSPAAFCGGVGDRFILEAAK